MSHRYQKKPSKILQEVFFYIGIPAVSACLIFMFLYGFQVSNVTTPSRAPIVVATTIISTPNAAPTVEPPVRLSIATIGIDAVIQPVGLTSEGAMDIDANPDEVAWYKLGPKPGEIGSAVIAGHYGWSNGHGSVFNNLHTLKIDDSIAVYSDTGKEIVFIVRGMQKYDPTADATEVFRSTDGKAHLNLITCEGDWVNDKDSYSNRLVVFTDLKT